MPAPPSSPLMRVLVKPSKLVSTLNWKATSSSRGRGSQGQQFTSNGTGGQPSILTMDIRRERVHLAVALHPEVTHDAGVLVSHSISRTSSSDLPECLSDMLSSHAVVGMVVAWPLQYDTGRVGAACGRVLHTLEQRCSGALSLDGTTTSRPIPLCLWTPPELYAARCTTEDRFGRSPKFSKATRTIDRDEEGKYIYSSHKHDHTVFADEDDHGATTLWMEFCHSYWPEHCDIEAEQVSDIPSLFSSASLTKQQYGKKTSSSKASSPVEPKRSVLSAMSSAKRCLIQV